MSESRLHLHFLSLILLSCVSPSSFFDLNIDYSGYFACHPHQTKALTEFMNEFHSSHCNLSDPYNGVWCDNSTGAVTMLRLRACLSGTLKPNSSLFKLRHLRYLALSQNNFISSSLPSEFGNLNRLEFLNLSNNGFLGQVPFSFSNLSLLSHLSLSLNELTGSFPLLWTLTKLSVLSLSNNHFSGTLNPSSSLFEFHHLRYLNLGYNHFNSLFPSEFGNLNKLEVLSLASNEFSGKVPPTISNLTSLTELYLDYNQLAGSLPLVLNLTMLSVLSLYENHFSGTIPSSLFTMPSLTYLDLRGNDLSGSIIIPNSSTPSMLDELYLGYNHHFEGNTIEQISKLVNLKLLDLSSLNTSYPIDVSLLLLSLKSLLELDLSANSISPASLDSNSDFPPNLEFLSLQGCGITEFPNILKNLENLEFIALSDNRIKGKVPEWLWNLPHLYTLYLPDNLITGFEGPVDVLVNSSLKNLEIGANCFEGAIPILPLSINLFAASHNRFTGRIPLSICNCKSLTHLILHNNNLTGPIPQCFSRLTSLYLRKNNIEGSIPDSFYMGASLRSLDVGHNRLTGKLPRSFQNCSFLEFLVVERNGIKDKFPFWLKALPNLKVLILRSNNFYGSISPPDQGPLGFPELRIFEISNNKFTGSLPSRYFINWKVSSLVMNEDGDDRYMERTTSLQGLLAYRYIASVDLQYKGLSMVQERVLTSYATIDFSGNRINGEIPESIGLLKSLIALNLSNNAFTGHIPFSLANLSNLESLDLSRNNLSGTIPYGLGSLSFLEYINVSHNQLKGEIPQGTQITGQAKSSFEGNAGLCGLPLQETCFGPNLPPTHQPLEEEEEEEQLLNWKGVEIGYGPGVLLGLAIAQLIATYKPEWLVKIIGPNKRRNR